MEMTESKTCEQTKKSNETQKGRNRRNSQILKGYINRFTVT